MRGHLDPGWGHLKAGLVGALVAAVVLLSFPVVAAVGDTLLLGRQNNADAVTQLSGSAAVNLRLTNNQPAAPALELRVVAGAPPLKVNSTVRVPNLNADRLDGKHASAFLLAGDIAADANLLDGMDSTAFSPASHDHAGLYLGLGDQAADANLLDGFDSTEFARAGHDHAGWYLPLNGIAANADLLDGLDSAAFASTGHNHAGTYLSVAGVAADSSLLDGLDSTAFARSGALCPPGEGLLGYGRNGVMCTGANGTVGLDTVGATDNISMVLDAAGRPVIAYFDQVNQHLKLLHCGDPTCSTGNSIVTVDNTVGAGHGPSLVIHWTGNPVIAYGDAVNNDLKAAFCTDPNCTAPATIVTLDPDVWATYTSMALLPLTLGPVVAYYDATNGDLKLAACGTPLCTTPATITAVATTGDVGAFASLAIDAGGRPVISYYDQGNADLRLVVCGNPTCTAGNVDNLVDGGSGAGIGFFTSLVLDRGDRPVISYQDIDNADLKLVRCGNEWCSSGNTIRTLYTSGDTGWYTSLALDEDDRPAVAFQSQGVKDLMLARCADPTCSADTVIRLIAETGDVGYWAALVLDDSGHPVVVHGEGAGGIKLSMFTG